MPDNEFIALHINVPEAASFEKLRELVTTALSMQNREQEIVVPNGYRCIECYQGDGEHETNCSMRLP